MSKIHLQAFVLKQMSRGISSMFHIFLFPNLFVLVVVQSVQVGNQISNQTRHHSTTWDYAKCPHRGCIYARMMLGIRRRTQAAAAPAHRPHTPPNCKDPELQALAPPPSSASPPFPTSITPSPVAASRVPRKTSARACMVGHGCIGILD